MAVETLKPDGPGANVVEVVIEEMFGSGRTDPKITSEPWSSDTEKQSVKQRARPLQEVDGEVRSKTV